MRRLFALLFAFGFIIPAVRAAGVDVTLRGSPGSMTRQNDVAHELGYRFVHSERELDSLVARGAFIRVESSPDLVVDDGVSHPFARPIVRLFLERLARQYHAETGEKLVVTSLTRPTSEQPRNSHALSVHPAGIAVDLRVSHSAAARQWLESVFLKLERQGLLDITREHWPPHYHVAVFPDEYQVYLEHMIGRASVVEALRFEERKQEKPEPRKLEPVRKVAAAVPPVDTASAQPWWLLALLPILVFGTASAHLWFRLRALRES